MPDLPPIHWLHVHVRGWKSGGTFAGRFSYTVTLQRDDHIDFVETVSWSRQRASTPGLANWFPLRTMVQRAAEDYRAALNQASSYIQSLPVFVSAQNEHVTAELAAALQEVLDEPNTYAMPVEVVATRNLPPPQARSMPLPLRVTAVGVPWVGQTLQNVRDQAWYFQQAEVSTHTWVTDVRTWPEWTGNRSEANGDIVITAAENAARMMRALDRARQSHTVVPGLVVVLDRSPGTTSAVPLWRVPPGVAVVNIPASDVPGGGVPDPATVLYRFLEEMTHDRPLHDVVSLLRREFHVSPAYQLQLISDPVANENLRLSRMLREVLAMSREATALGRPGQVSEFVGKLPPAEGGLESMVPAESAMPADLLGLKNLFENAGKVADRSGHEQGMAMNYSRDFSQEGRGLVPMSQLAAGFAITAQMARDVAREAQLLFAASPHLAEAVEQAQERKVDAWLSHRGPSDDVQRASPQDRLPPGAQLRLHVRIGQRGPETHIVGDSPALDPLLPPLPDEQPHELDIYLFPRDFKVTGPMARRVALPRFGGTPAVEWDLVAPGTEFSEPYADLRFSVHYQNQLLQSFRLRAVIGDRSLAPNETEIFAEGRRFFIECDFSQTRRFGALEKLGPRVAAFSLNGSDKTHDLTLVKDGRSAGIRVEKTILGPAVQDAREALRKALGPRSDGSDSFTFDAQDFRLTSEPAFAEAVGNLATQGRLIYDHLYSALEDGGAEALLGDLRARNGEVLQVARIDRLNAFPWALLYDFNKPPAGARDVCRGQGGPGSLCTCEKEMRPQKWCLRGFWGFRLVIENQLNGPPPLDNEPGKIADRRSAPSLEIVAGVRDPFVNSLVALPLATSPLGRLANPAPSDVLDSLRDPAKRPSVFLYVGHHGTGSGTALSNPQLLIDGVSVLELSHFTRERQSAAAQWLLAPRPLILLLACSAGTDRVDTGTSLAVELMRLGAAGVLATECTVYTGIVARLARDLMGRLENKEPMGAAWREIIFDLAVEGCPLGLAFTYLGSSETRLPPSS